MSNPMFNEAAFERAKQEQGRQTQEENLRAEGFAPRYQSRATNQVMTLEGTVNKMFLLLALCVVGGCVGWIQAAALSSMSLLVFVVLSIGAFILGIWTRLKPSVSPVTAPIYAVIEGGLLGFISAIYNLQYQGIVL